MMRIPLLILLLALPAAASAQAVQGRLLARENNAALAGGTVQLVGADSQMVAQALTDQTGTFTLQAPAPGRYFLLGAAPGYEASETDYFVVGAQGKRVSFVIGRAAGQVDTGAQPAAGAYGGFYERMGKRGGNGRFFSRERIDELKPQSVADLLRRVSSLEVRAEGGAGLAVRPRQALSIRTGCWSTFYLNGMRVEGDAVVGLNPLDVEGVEVYTHGSVPAQFNAVGSACGVVGIWLRSR